MARLKNFHCFSCKVNVYCRVLSYVAIEITQYPYHIAGYEVENNEYWNIENIDTLLMIEACIGQNASCAVVDFA